MIVSTSQKKKNEVIDRCIPSSLRSWFHIVFCPWSMHESPLRPLSPRQPDQDKQSMRPLPPSISDVFGGLEVRVPLEARILLRTIPFKVGRGPWAKLAEIMTHVILCNTITCRHPPEPGEPGLELKICFDKLEKC